MSDSKYLPVEKTTMQIESKNHTEVSVGDLLIHNDDVYEVIGFRMNI